MNRGIKIGLIIFGSLGVIATAGYFFLKYQADKLKAFCYDIIGATINNFSLTNVNLTINLEVGNRSIIPFTIKGYTINAIVNNQPVGVIQNQNMNQEVKPNGLTPLAVVIDFNPSSALKNAFNLSNIQNLSANLNATAVSLKGNVVVAIAGVTANLPIEITMSINDMISKKSDSSSTSRVCVKDASGKLV